MTRTSLLLLSALALAAASNGALAKDKAYCRGYAESVAARDAGDVTQDAAPGNFGDAVPGVSGTEQTVAPKDTMTVAADGSSAADPAVSERRREVYRRAYAECRAS